ncbi:histidine phosphatase family protein [Acidisoma sp.]|uniref:histidine phosphatase family protein n=1 Tax=Acidisoma sp. TaxID=1872115 RepID=UPI003B00A646
MEPQDLRIYLVRHGETAWSRSGQHTGRTDMQLSEPGEAEAKALAPWLRGIHFGRVLTSPLRRARRTCELAGLGRTVAADANLEEWNYGKFEGLTSAQIHLDRPDWLIYRDGAPGGETPSEVSDRADQVIAQMTTLHGNVAIFTHGHFGTVLGARWVGLPILEAQHFSLSTASMSVLAYSPAHPETRVIALWNANPATLRDGG